LLSNQFKATCTVLHPTSLATLLTSWAIRILLVHKIQAIQHLLTNHLVLFVDHNRHCKDKTTKTWYISISDYRK
jgi:hypothetical protein